MFRDAEERIQGGFDEIKNKINDVEYKMKNPEFYGIVNFIYVYISGSNGTDIYSAIDDIFVSYIGNHYMKVFINQHFIEVDINKIDMVSNTETIKDSYIVKNWVQIKMNILRGKKLERIIGED